MIKKSVPKRLLACISVLMLTAVSCDEVKSTTDSSESVSQASEQAVTEQSENNGEDIVLTMVISDYDERTPKLINEFNAADNGYKIVTKNYNEKTEEGMSEEDLQEMDFRLIQDLINKDDIDIVYSGSFGNDAKFQILKNKGTFVDLYPFMENDDEVNTSTLNQHILSLNEIDGKLYALPTSYTVQTLIGSTEYVGDKENWTMDDFLTHWEQMPEGATICGSIHAENIYYTVLRGNLESFINYEDATVSFNSPEFKRMLEFCGQFESNGNEKTDYDYNAPGFVFEGYLTGIMSSSYFKDSSDPHNLGDKAPYTMVGYPSSNGKGAYIENQRYYSICAKSSPEKQKGAWEFIRTFGTEDYQVDRAITFEMEYQDEEGKTRKQYSEETGFCVNNNAFNRIASNIIAGNYYTADYFDKGEKYTFELPTQEDVDKLVSYINSINRLETSIDRALWWIVEEEVMKYFSGESTLDYAVSMIQNRASIWVSEQA